MNYVEEDLMATLRSEWDNEGGEIDKGVCDDEIIFVLAAKDLQYTCRL